MMISPLEAAEVLLYLRQHDALNADLKNKCQETITKFRLDHPAGNGKRSFIRRTYTCPFFGHQELGCPLPKEVKPYGCLAFNSHHTDLKAGEYCYSEQELLVKREDSYPWEKEINESIKQKFNLIWDKTPLPLGLLELWEADFNEFQFVPEHP